MCSKAFGCACEPKIQGKVSKIAPEIEPTTVPAAAYFSRTRAEFEIGEMGGHCPIASAGDADNLLFQIENLLIVIGGQLAHPALFARSGVVRRAMTTALRGLVTLKSAVGYHGDAMNLTPEDRWLKEHAKLKALHEKLQDSEAKVAQLEADAAAKAKPSKRKPAHKSRRKVRPTPTAPTPEPMPKLIAERMAGGVNGALNGKH